MSLIRTQPLSDGPASQLSACFTVMHFTFHERSATQNEI